MGAGAGKVRRAQVTMRSGGAGISAGDREALVVGSPYFEVMEALIDLAIAKNYRIQVRKLPGRGAGEHKAFSKTILISPKMSHSEKLFVFVHELAHGLSRPRNHIFTLYGEGRRYWLRGLL